MPTPFPRAAPYIENSPVGFYGGSKGMPSLYQWEFLLRYGLTDNLEFRIFSNGLSAQGKPTPHRRVLAFGLRLQGQLLGRKLPLLIPAMGLEVYLQTTFGSPAFNGGTQPSMNLLFDQSLPLEIGFEYNFGITGVQNSRVRSSTSSAISGRFSARW